jgi:ribose transport system ATP-binding protein
VRTEARRPALSVRGVSKRFGATQALDDVEFTLRSGTVHALLGGNGSGKSTLVKILAGAYRADRGTIVRSGRQWDVGEYDATTARSIGLRFVHQTLAVFPSLTVAENIALARGYPRHPGGRIDWDAIEADAERLLRRYDLAGAARLPVARLRPASQALVAIAAALGDGSAGGSDSGTPDVLIVDEATAALPRGEADDLLTSLRALAADGHAVVFISHRIDEVLAVADEVTILRDGRVAGSCVREGLTHGALVAMLAGGVVSDTVHTPPSRTHTRLRVIGLRAGPLRSVDLQVSGGEILGISGLLGSGRSTLLHTLFDPERREAGVIEVDGRVLDGTPAASMDAGVALVPEDRARQAVFPSRTVADNLTEAMSGRYWRNGWLSSRRAHAEAREMIRRHGIVTASELSPIESLSGGNQQKMVLARWLARRPAVLLLDEPTQGVDVHARRAVHDAVRLAVNDGACAVVASSDLDELIELSDRILVLANGCMIAELHPPFEPSQLLALDQTSADPTNSQLERSSQ